MSVLHNSRQMTIPPLLSVRTQTPRSAGVALPWYRAGGAPEPYAAWLPKGAASLAASYLRIAGSGGYANLDPAVVGVGVAPEFDAATGWLWANTRYLDTGIIPAASTWTYLVRFSGERNINAALFGIRQTRDLYCIPVTGTQRAYRHYTSTAVAPTGTVNAGVMGFADRICYLNGAADGTLGAALNAFTISIFLGRANNGLGGTLACAGYMQAFVAWNTTLDGTQMAAVSAAMAAL